MNKTIDDFDEIELDLDDDDVVLIWDKQTGKTRKVRVRDITGRVTAMKVGLAAYDPTRLYKKDESTIYNRRIYQATADTTGTFKPGDWIETGSAETSGFPAYNNTQSYAIDFYVEFQKRIWKSLANGNVGVTPGSDPTKWEEISANDGKFGNYWQPGLYNHKDVVRWYDTGIGRVRLLESTDPTAFQSTDIPNEYQDGKWRDVGGSAGQGGGGIDDNTVSTETTYSSAKIQQLVSAFTSVERVVADIAARDALTGKKDSENVFVQDATGDATVSSGWAIYKWNQATSTWLKIAEGEGLDINLTAYLQKVNAAAEGEYAPADSDNSTGLFAGLLTSGRLMLKAALDRVVTVVKNHLADDTRHITATERSDWNSKAAGNHTHSEYANLDTTIPTGKYDPVAQGQYQAGTTKWRELLGYFGRDIAGLLSGSITISGNKIFSGALILQKTIRFGKVPLTAVGTTFTADMSLGHIFELTLTANSTLAVTNLQENSTNYFRIRNTGNFTLTFPTQMKFPNGNTPIITPGAGKRDLVTCACFDNGSGVLILESVIAFNLPS